MTTPSVQYSWCLPFVQSLEILRAHPHFSFDDDIDGALKRKRHGFYRLYILRDVLPYCSVAARRRGNENSFLILQNDFKTVNFEFAYVRGSDLPVRGA